MSWKHVGSGSRGLGPTPQQKLYIKAYLETLDGKLSAELAGYSKKSAVDISKGLQRKPAVRAAIEKGLEEKEREVKDRAGRAMEHTYAQATADIGGLFDANDKMIPVRKLPRKLRRAISSVEIETRWEGRGEDAAAYTVTKVKLHDKRASQELFAKYAGKLRERLEVDATKSFEQVVLEAARMRRERAGAAAEAKGEDADS